MTSPPPTHVNRLIDTVASFLREHSVRSETVVVGVSGGPDSMALLVALDTLKSEFSLQLHVAHLDHQLRGTESERDAAFVAEQAQRLSVAATISARDVRTFQESSGNSSLEDAARQVRHAFFNDVVDRVGATRIALGHSADDQAETVLLQLVRGAGLSGLRGMLPVRGRIIRPLLTLRRTDIEEFLKARGVTYRVDQTNFDVGFARNRMRAEVLPILESEFNPQAVENICRAAFLIAQTENWAERELDRIFTDLVLSRSGSVVALKVGALDNLPNILRRLAIRRAMDILTESEFALSLKHVAAIEELLDDACVGSKVSLPGGFVAERRMDVLELRSEVPPEAPSDWVLPLPVPGTVVIPDMNLEVWCDLVPKPTDVMDPPQTDSHEAYMDHSKIRGTLCIRNRRKGDRFKPLGAPGARKLKDYFIDAKVPSSKRDRIPLLVDEEGIICVLGFVIADRVRVSHETQELLHIRLSGAYGTAAAGEKR